MTRMSQSSAEPGEWWDGKRTRLVVGYVGEDGIEPDVAYTVRDGALVRAETQS